MTETQARILFDTYKSVQSIQNTDERRELVRLLMIMLQHETVALLPDTEKESEA